VLAASNRNAHDAVTAGRLRKDLLYRLQVFPLYVPPLRERLDDVGELAEYFLAEFCARNNFRPRQIDPPVIPLLSRYHWPGNVRELSNAIHRAYIMTDGEWITQIGLSQEPSLSADFNGRSFQIGVGDRIDAVEKRLILATVQHTHTKEAAAEILGISVKTLYNRLRAYESGADLERTSPPRTSGDPASLPEGAALLPPPSNPRTSVK
jgi:DNA-binding NtrC family response regulator